MYGSRQHVPTSLRHYRHCLITVQGMLALPVDHAIPMGLILSEIASNAAKYAFTAGKPGKLLVCLDYSEGLVRMKGMDDGPGFDLAEARVRGGLGLVLIEALAAQIKGTINHETGHGTPSVPGDGQEKRDRPAGSAWVLDFPCPECRTTE